MKMYRFTIRFTATVRYKHRITQRSAVRITELKCLCKAVEFGQRFSMHRLHSKTQINIRNKTPFAANLFSQHDPGDSLLSHSGNAARLLTRGSCVDQYLELRHLCPNTAHCYTILRYTTSDTLRDPVCVEYKQGMQGTQI